MTAGDLRQWLTARRVGEEREREELRHTCPSPEASLRQALRLIAFAADRHGWPIPDDPRSLAEDEEGYQRWSRLRAAWQRHAERTG